MEAKRLLSSGNLKPNISIGRIPVKKSESQIFFFKDRCGYSLKKRKLLRYLCLLRRMMKGRFEILILSDFFFGLNSVFMLSHLSISNWRRQSVIIIPFTYSEEWF